LVRAYMPGLARVAKYAITPAVAAVLPDARKIAVVEGVVIWRLGSMSEGQSGVKPPHSTYQPFSFRFGLFLSMVGIGALTCVSVYRVQRGRHITPR